MSFDRDDLLWKELKRNIYSIFPKRCMKCKDKKTLFHVDHILPKSKFPEFGYCFDNLQILCATCNRDKSDKYFTDYRNLTQRRTAIKTANKKGLSLKPKVEKKAGETSRPTLINRKAEAFILELKSVMPPSNGNKTILRKRASIGFSEKAPFTT